MTTIKKIIILISICILAFGCKDSFLDLAPISNANADNFYKTKSDFDVAVNAAYATLYTMYSPESGNSYCGEEMSDNCTMHHVAAVNGVTETERWAFKDYNIQTTNRVVYNFWQQDYNALYSVNIVLDKIEGASLDATYKELTKSEMMFLRALYYFDMVQLWGDIPLVTKPITNFTQSYNILRSPASDIYNQIVQDLLYAIDRLPLANAVSAPGRISKGAAQTLLGKVYLTMGNKSAAAQVLTEVYNSNQYQLLPNYADLWGTGTNHKNTKESIFEVQYKGGAGNPYSTYYPIFAPFENFTITSASGGMNEVTDDLFNEYEKGDVRRDLSIDTGYTKIINNQPQFIANKFPKKWTDKTVAYGSEYCDNNFIVLRYADLLLLLSEATGDAQYLNQVRARVGLPAFGSVGYPVQYNTLGLAIEHERRVELALEFHRWFDLKRTGRAIAVLSAKGKPVTQEKLLLPIPDIVRQQNKAITQNPGYN